MFLSSRLKARSPQLLATLVIFSLSAGVLGGVLFYMDSTSSEVLEEMTQYIPIDMKVKCTSSFYESSTLTLESIRNIVEEQPIVSITEIVSVIEGIDSQLPETHFQRYAYLGVEDTLFTSFSDAIELLPGALPIDDNSCYVESAIYEFYELEIGGNYTANVIVYDEYYQPHRYNQTFVIAGIFTSTTFHYTGDSGEVSATYLRLITTRQGLYEKYGFIGHENEYGIFESIWTKFDSNFITRSNPSIVEDTLNDAKMKIEQRVLPFAKVSDFEILGVVYGYNSWSSTMIIIAIAFSIPSIVMGILLIQYNSDLTEDDRRRDIGTLITRGSSGWQSFSWIITGALIAGLFGSIGAVLTGGFSAILSGGVRELLVFDETNYLSFNLLLEPYSILSVFLFTFIIGLVIALPGAIRALLMTPVEAHSIIEKQSLLGEEKISKPTMEIVAIGISGFLIIPILSLLLYGNIPPASYLLFAITVISMFGIFITSTARVLSRSTSFVKSRLLSLVRRPSLKVSSVLLSRYTNLAKRSEAMGVMFIGLVITAGMFSSISAVTGSTHMKNLYLFDTGADVVMNVKEGFQNVTLDLLENITLIEGVNNASGMVKTIAFVSYMHSTRSQGINQINTTYWIYGIQPASWLASAFIQPYFTKNSTPSQVFPLLADNYTNVISSFKPVRGFVDGAPRYHNNLTINLMGPVINYTLNCSIVDVFSNDYSYESTNYMPGQTTLDEFILMNISYVHSCLNSTRLNRIYVDIDENQNITKIIEDLRNFAPLSFDVVSTHERIDAILASRTGQSIHGVYTLNVIYSLAYLTIGMILISAVRSRKLQRQFSILRALGIRTVSVMFTISLDTILTVLLGCFIGLFLGLILSNLILQLPLAFLGVTSDIVWTRLPIFLVIPSQLVLGIISLCFGSALITAIIVTRRSLSSNIADDFRYYE